MPGHLKENPLLNPDFRDMLSALCAEKAEFLIVGAYALAAYGHPRAKKVMGRPQDLADVAWLETH